MVLDFAGTSCIWQYYSCETEHGKATYSVGTRAAVTHITLNPHACFCMLTPGLPCAARFSPDDKFSQQRYTLKKRFNLLPTQQEELEL